MIYRNITALGSFVRALAYERPKRIPWSWLRQKQAFNKALKDYYLPGIIKLLNRPTILASLMENEIEEKGTHAKIDIKHSRS